MFHNLQIEITNKLELLDRSNKILRLKDLSYLLRYQYVDLDKLNQYFKNGKFENLPNELYQELIDWLMSIEYRDLIQICQDNIKNLNFINYMCQTKPDAMLYFFRKDNYSFHKLAEKVCDVYHKELFSFISKLDKFNWNVCLQAAVDCQHEELIEIALQYGATEFNESLYYACKNGNKKLIDLFIEKGADKWDNGLFGAAQGGHIMIAEYMMTKGAIDLETAMNGAISNGQKKFVIWLIEKGYDNFNEGLKIAASENQCDLIDYFINKGADNLNEAFLSACVEGRLNAIKKLIDDQANDFNQGLINVYQNINHQVAIHKFRNNEKWENFKNDQLTIIKLLISYGANNLREAQIHEIFDSLI